MICSYLLQSYDLIGNLKLHRRTQKLPCSSIYSSRIRMTSPPFNEYEQIMPSFLLCVNYHQSNHMLNYYTVHDTFKHSDHVSFNCVEFPCCTSEVIACNNQMIACNNRGADNILVLWWFNVFYSLNSLTIYLNPVSTGLFYLVVSLGVGGGVFSTAPGKLDPEVLEH